MSDKGCRAFNDSPLRTLFEVVHFAAITTRRVSFEVAQLSPFSPASGEKVAVRPDEGVYGKMKYEKKPVVCYSRHMNQPEQEVVAFRTDPKSHCLQPADRMGDSQRQRPAGQ